MSFLFFLSAIGMIAVVPIHFISVSHIDLEKRFGEERGARTGAILGMISGWGIFLFLFGLWVSPQLQFAIPVMQEVQLVIPIFGLLTLQTSLLHMLLSLVFIVPGASLGIRGVLDIGLEPSETHRSTRVITTGIYSRIRHPQYLGAILSHVGMTFLMSGFYSLLVTPLVILVNWLLCWKEEKELVREFGESYVQYKKRVPMLLPLRRKMQTASDSGV